MIFFKFLSESVVMALQQLAGNKLRSFLSLLGIVIGIWSIISVLSAVDSLEMNIRGSFDTRPRHHLLEMGALSRTKL